MHQTCLNGSCLTRRLYHCNSAFCFVIPIRTVCSGELLPDTPSPAKISKRSTLKLRSIVSAYNLYRRQHTSKTVVCEVLTQVFGNLIFAVHEIDSVEPSEVISNQGRVGLPPPVN